MSFYRIMLLHGVPTDLLNRVIVPKMARGTVRRLRDDFDELNGGEDALRWIGDRNGIRWDWKRWDRKQREHLTEKLQELIDKGVFAVLQTTSFLPLLPAFHQVDGQWQITRDVRSLSHSAEGRFTLDLERRKREEREREVWQGRNQPPTEVLVAAAGPGFRLGTLGPHVDGEKVSSTNTGNSKANIHSQEQANSCVVASSRNMIEQKTGKDIPESELRDQMKAIMNKPDHDFEKDGINPVHAQALLKKHGVESELKTGLSLNDLEAETLKTPVMVGFKKPGHRVILDSVGRNAAGEAVFNVHDPAPSFSGKPRAMSESEFSRKYNDKAVVIVPK